MATLEQVSIETTPYARLDRENRLINGILKGPTKKKGRYGFRGDIVLKFQDQAVPDFETLTTLIGARAPGEKVTIVLRRGDVTLKKEVELGAWK